MEQHKPIMPLLMSLLVAGFLTVLPASAQQSTDTSAEIKALQQEIQALKQGQQEILRRLQALQTAIERGAPRPQATRFRGADISIEGAPIKGKPNAKFAIIEFSDYQCPFCRRFSNDTLPQLLENYVETGKLKFVFRDFPLERIHPAAATAAVAARCAGDQSKYWQMHDLFFEKQRSVVAQEWLRLAEAVKLDLAKFETCMADDSHAQAVQQSIAEGRRLGVNGTPAFFLGTVSDDGLKVKATEMVVGARSYENLKAIIDRLLSATSEM